MIALRKLTLENFQAIRGPAEFEFGKLTFLYGPNSVGKSAVFDAITLLALTARGDPRAAVMAKRSARRVPGTRPTPEISIGAKFFIDSEDLMGMESITIPAATQRSQHELFGRIADGVWIELEVRYDVNDPESISALRISIDNDIVLEYEDIPIEYGPYFRTDYALNPDPSGELLEPPEIRGEWRIHLNHPVARDVTPEVRGSCARSKLIFALSEDNMQSVRGVTCYAYPREGNRAFLRPDHLPFIFLPTEQELNDPNSMRATFYPNRSAFWNRKRRPELGDEHCRYLNQFLLDPGDADVKHYKQFLAQECDPGNSNTLFSDLRVATTRIDEFLKTVMSMVAGSLDMMRVPGNRSAVDSNHPIHLPSPVEINAQGQLEFLASGMPIWDFAPTVDVHKGERALTARLTLAAADFDWVLLPYALKCLRSDHSPEHDEVTTDFPNYCLQKYLHSLRQYRIEMECYRLEASQRADPLEDDSELADTKFAYFVLRETKGDARRSFNDVGSGLGYVFPVLAVLGEPKISAIEQPELHLHPRAQEELADVFLDAANRGHAAIIESHSEVFLQRIAKRMKETADRTGVDEDASVTLGKRLTITPQGIALYYFSPDPESGTRIRRLRFDVDGTLIDDWPDGMFASDWASGLDRIKLFSKIFRGAEAKTAWPWMKELDDADVQQWLSLAWFGNHMGPEFDYLFVGHAAKIAEKLLADKLLQPLKSTLTDIPIRSLDWWQDDFLKFLRKDWRPSLGWWFSTMCKLRSAATREHPAITVIREHIKSQPWSEAWDQAEDQNMRGLIKELSEARNAYSHTGIPRADSVAKTRKLIEDNGRPGLLFVAFGVKQAFGIRAQDSR